MKFFVYCHTNKINGKSYIGWCQTSVEDRWQRHILDSTFKERSFCFQRAIAKYGSNDDVWEHEILEVMSTPEGAKHAEKLWIAHRKTNMFREGHHGYNMTDGGDGTTGHKHSKESLEKIQHASKNMSPKTREKISIALKGGKRTSETKKLMSESSPTKGKTLEEVFGKDYAERVKSKQRGPRESVTGEKHPRSKVTTQNVLDIRERANKGESPEQLAPEFGLSVSGTRKIIARVTWRHI